jgi:hypothetical protein
MPTVAGSPVTVNQCVYSTVPNRSNDKYNSNNSKCMDLNLGSVGLNERSGLTILINLFPNPSSSKINIECEIEMKEIVVKDILGREIFSTDPNEKKIELDLTFLNEGIYFVGIETEKGMVVRKIVKE